ncbi:MAG: histidine phosphatase family protein [Alphaproteobacteria bacterium]|nr:histidine phosphatase family protein [Alphaproteobacteria bacterium]
MIPAKHFYMIRHGETKANVARLMAGSIDSPLTEKGRGQARAVLPILEKLEIKPKAIFHSHLSRARETAEILNKALNVTMNEEPDFAELHAGEWEGEPYEICKPMTHGWYDPPGGETYQQFLKRIKRAKIKTLGLNEAPVLIVCHGGVFRAFSKLFGIDSFGVRNCHLYEFRTAKTTNKFPWQAWHYEYYRDNEETLLCDCSLKNMAPMTRPSTMTPIPMGESQEISPQIRRTPCRLFHEDNISSFL